MNQVRFRRKKEVGVRPVAVERVTPNGRIVYSLESILASEPAQHHFKTLDRLASSGFLKKRAAAKS